ncbi:MAG: M23 family metallopeptidase [Chloroflexi bacterium]|nr:M23 family metallopeptidase [Chloroflexota bacterium]
MTFFRRWPKPLLLGVALALLLGGVWAGRTLVLSYAAARSDSNAYIARWFLDSGARASLHNARAQRCLTPLAQPAPFMLPSDGLIGLLWDDPAAPYTVFNPHTGIDIFGDGAPGTVPVYAAYGGYLTRLNDWLSSVIIRHDDPLQAGRTIWTYYTHMAARDGSHSFVAAAFPPGTANVWVDQGTLLGYQGEYAGAGAPIGMHVHFSIVRSDENGAFTNEARLANTLDPSPYFAMPLTTLTARSRPIACLPPP